LSGGLWYEKVEGLGFEIKGLKERRIFSPAWGQLPFSTYQKKERRIFTTLLNLTSAISNP
jgi:hypothetical protein